MTYRCVIFDFDGTLADTEKFVVTIYNQIAEKYGYALIDDAQYEKIKTMSFSKVLNVMDISYKKAMTLLAEGQKILKKNMDAVAPFEKDIASVLEQIKEQCPVIGVISSNTKKNIRLFLKNTRITSMDFVISSPLFSKESKIRSVMRRKKLSPEEILYVGDEQRDIVSSHHAGVDVAAAAWGYTSRQMLLKRNPTYLIHSLKDVVDILNGDFERCQEGKE